MRKGLVLQLATVEDCRTLWTADNVQQGFGDAWPPETDASGRGGCSAGPLLLQDIPVKTVAERPDPAGVDVQVRLVAADEIGVTADLTMPIPLLVVVDRRRRRAKKTSVTGDAAATAAAAAVPVAPAMPASADTVGSGAVAARETVRQNNLMLISRPLIQHAWSSEERESVAQGKGRQY